MKGAGGSQQPSAPPLLPRGSANLQRAASQLPGSPSLAQRHADVYISELLSYSLDRLRKEPELLAEEHTHVERSIQANAVTQYRAFIASAECVQSVQQQLAAACGRLDALLEDLPQLATACERFSRDAASVMEANGQYKQLLGHQTTLLELLEAPQLMDTCVRNGIYDEALDLQAFVGRMALMHPELAIVQVLLAQVTQVSHAMLQQLLLRLKSSIQLPECLRVIGYLRRMAAFQEPELRLQFLRCREECFAALVDELDDSDSYEYIKHLTDVYRLHLFDVVMQYRAIFYDSAAPTQPQDAAPPAGGMPRARESSVLHSWVQHRLALYMAALQSHLPAISEGGNLASVLEHCMYCGAALSRVGLDFQGLLQPVYELCTLRLFSANCAAAVEAFCARLEGHKWLPMHAPSFGGHKARAATAAAAAADDVDNSAVSEGVGPAEDLTPPYVLMEHFPLAVFTNGVLSALNELRHCALLGLQRPMASVLQAALEQVAAALVHYKHMHVLGEHEAPLFRAAARAMSDVVVSFLATCFGRVFPGGAARLDATAVSVMLQELAEAPAAAGPAEPAHATAVPASQAPSAPAIAV